MPSGHKTIGVRVDMGVWEQIQALAVEKRMSISYIGEELIRIGLEECAPEIVEKLERTPLTSPSKAGG